MSGTDATVNNRKLGFKIRHQGIWCMVGNDGVASEREWQRFISKWRQQRKACWTVSAVRWIPCTCDPARSAYNKNQINHLMSSFSVLFPWVLKTTLFHTVLYPYYIVPAFNLSCVMFTLDKYSNPRLHMFKKHSIKWKYSRCLVHHFIHIFQSFGLIIRLCHFV